MKVTFKHNISSIDFLKLAEQNIATHSDMPRSLSPYLKFNFLDSVEAGEVHPVEEFRFSFEFPTNPLDRGIELHAPSSYLKWDRNTIVFEGPRRSLHDAFESIIPFLKTLEVRFFDSWNPAIPWFQKYGNQGSRDLEVPNPLKYWAAEQDEDGWAKYKPKSHNKYGYHLEYRLKHDGFFEVATLDHGNVDSDELWDDPSKKIILLNLLIEQHNYDKSYE